MKREFNQRRGINSRKFILTSEKIIVETKTLSKINKYELKLDRIGLDVQYQSDNTIAGKIFVGVCASVIIGVTIEHFLNGSIDNNTLILNYILWTFLGAVGFLKQHQDDIYLVGGQTNLVFYRNVPSEKSVLEFISEVQSQVKIYFKAKYSTFDSTTLEQDFYGRINWLRDREIIDFNEYVELKANWEAHKLL